MAQEGIVVVADERDPIRDTYDAIVDVGANQEWGGFAFGLVKCTYQITQNGCTLAEPEPLFQDMRDPDIEPRIKPGSDFWAVKLATDVVVQGSAYPPDGQSTDRMDVRVSIGALEKEVAVFGKRYVEWIEQGNVRFTDPEPFEEVEITWENAYGGTDYRVVDPAMEEVSPEVEAARLQSNHPGMYPRNPFGKGYLVKSDPVEDFELPQLEDPDDLLTPDRVITGDPKMWYQQPLPWAFDWVHPMMFPRFVHFIDRPEAWYPAPDDERLPEIKRGFLSEGFKQKMDERPLEKGPDPRFRQGASHGLVLHDVPKRAPVRIEGMHPEKSSLQFRLPDPPSIEMQVEDRREAVEPRLHSIVVRPEEEMFYVLYGTAMGMDRPLIPGIHKHIPVALYVNGDRPVPYDAPVPIRERLAAAKEEQEGEG